LSEGELRAQPKPIPLPTLYSAGKDPGLWISRGKGPHGASRISRDGLWDEENTVLVLATVSDYRSIIAIIWCSAALSFLLTCKEWFSVVQELQVDLFLNILDQDQKKSITWDIILHPIPSHL